MVNHDSVDCLPLRIEISDASTKSDMTFFQLDLKEIVKKSLASFCDGSVLVFDPVTKCLDLRYNREIPNRR